MNSQQTNRKLKQTVTTACKSDTNKNKTTQNT